MKRPILFPLLFSIACPVFAQNYTPLNGPYGGEVYDIIVSGSTLVGSVPGQGIVLSTDGGTTWSESNTGITDFYIRDLEKDPVSGKIFALANSRLFSSSDDGAAWITEASSGFSGGNFLRKTSNYFFILTTSGKLYRSQNGATWSLINTATTSYVTDFETTSSGLFISTSGSAVYRSTDLGLTFTQMDAGEGLNDTYVQSLSISGSNIYALASNALYKSSNNGANWAAVNDPGLTDSYFYGVVQSIGSSVFIFNTSSAKTWVSSDQGTTWSAAKFPLEIYGPGYTNNIQSLLAESPSVLYIAFWDLGLFKTTDGGITWEQKNTGITGHNAYNTNSLMYLPANNRLLYATGYPFGFYLSIDDGASWDFVKGDPNDKSISGFKQIGTTLYAFGNGLNKSTDDAQTWTEVNDGKIGGCYKRLDALAFKDETTFYSYYQYDCSGVSGYYLLTSADAGVTWLSDAINNMPSRTSSYVSSTDLHIDSDGYLYLLIYNYTSGINRMQLYKIDPATKNATLIDNLGTTAGIFAIDSYQGKLYLLTTDKKILISDDGAATWETKPTTATFGVLKIINENTFYILNSSPGAILSTDGGDSWSDVETFGNSRNAAGVVVSPSNYAYIQVNFGRLLKSNEPVIPPTAPTGLQVNGFSHNYGELTWTDNSVNEEYFIIEMSVGDNTGYDSVGTDRNFGQQNFVSWQYPQLEPETQYFFRVRAKGSGGKSGYSNEVSLTTLPDCSASSNIPVNRSWTATTLDESGVGIKTDPAVAITGSSPGRYIISNLNIGSSIAIHSDVGALIVENCGSVYKFESLDIQRSNGTWDPATNTLTIHWKTQSQYPAFSETTVFTLNDTDPAPVAPTDVSAYVKTSTETVVTWTGSNFSTEYQLQRSTASGTGFVNVGDPVNDQTYLKIDDSSFSLGQTYYYRVIAIGLGGASPPSAEAVLDFQTPLFDAISLPGFDYSTQGISWADIDNDNDEDLLVSPFVGALTSPIVLYENLGNGSLQPATAPGLSEYVSSAFRSISVGDANNDGLLDLLTNGAGDVGGDIFINKGNKEFERIPFTTPTSLGWFGAFVDFNNDGRLDASFSDSKGPQTSSETPYAFFTQNEDGEFVPYELGQIAADVNLSYGGSWADYDNDGDQDFIRGNNGVSPSTPSFDQLYKNNGDGTFSAATGSVFEQDYGLRNRSFSWADIDNDLDLDLFVGHNGSNLSNMLYQNNGDGTFTRLTTSLPAQREGKITYGSAWGDIDNDGDQDLVVGSNFQSYLYLNDGTGVFTKYTGTEYLVASDVTRTNIAFAMADFDNNGTLDIATGKNIPSTISFPTILLKNNLIPGANSHWLKIKLIGTTSNRAAIGARIIITTPDNKKQMRAISSHTGYGSCNSLIAHFGLKNQNTVTAIQIHWPSGIVQNLGPHSADQTITVTEDGAGPTNTLLNPLDNALNVPPGTDLEITFDETPFPQSEKKLSLYVTSDLATPIFQGDVSASALAGNTVTFNPPADLEQLTPYTAILDAAAFADQYGNLSPEISWTFTTNDITRPAISFTPPPSNTKGASTTFSPLATDNASVTNVTLHYRQISKKDFLTLSGTLNSTIANQYDFPIPSTFFDETGLEYYFTATDPALNEGRSPAAGTHKTYTLYEEANTNITTLGFGGHKTDWKIFAIPFDLDDKTIASIFDELVGKTALKVKFDYAFLSYKDQNSWIEYPSFTTVQRGRGYFSNIVNPAAVRVGDQLVAPPNDRDNLFSLDLSEGWNMIGNPYLSAVSWSDVATYNDLTGTAGEIKKYISGAYSADDQNLQPYEGGFVFAASAITGLEIPFKGQTSSGRKGFHNLGNDIDAESWALKLKLNQGELSCSLGAIGMVPDASLTFDDYDDITPPRLFDYLELNFMHPEFHAKRFSRDIVPTQETFNWDFKVDSNLSGIAELSWDQTAIAPASRDMFLLDKARYKLINMKNTGAYSFDPKGSRDFVIYFGKGLKISPPAISLGGAFPNPTDGNTVIGFSLPELGGMHQHTTIRIVDAMGRHVATVADGTFNPGYHEVTWNAKELISGFYTYRLTVNGQKGKEIHIGKLIIK